MDIANDLHLYPKLSFKKHLKFKFVNSIDELLDSHIIYQVVYKWLLKHYKNKRWNLFEYYQVINLSFSYLFIVQLYKHPENEWVDIKSDFESLILEDFTQDVDKTEAVMQVLSALVYCIKGMKYFASDLSEFMDTFKESIQEIILTVASLLKKGKLPELNLTIGLDDVSTKRILLCHGAQGCYIIHDCLSSKTERTELESKPSANPVLYISDCL